MTAEGTGTEKERAEGGLSEVLVEVVHRLTSQPLLFGLGILLLLVIAAGIVADVSTLVLPALGIFVIGAVVWLIVELPKARASAHTAGPAVRVRARDVGQGGTVTGIEGLPTSSAPPGVDVEGRRVDGRVSGAAYAEDRSTPEADVRPDTTN